MNHYPKSTSFFTRKLRAAGDFYMRHRRVFATAKVVILAGVMTFAFTVRSDNGKLIQHGAASTFAGDLCGNGSCDSRDAKCDINNRSCEGIGNNSGACASVTGCSVNIKDTYTCNGSSFSCSAIADKTACGGAGCFRNGSCSNSDGKGKTVPETCASIVGTQCSTVDQYLSGACSRDLVSSTTTCAGSIEEPATANDCISFGTLFAPFGYTANRIDGYKEDTKSCPADCSTSTCGNDTIEGTEFCDDGMYNGYAGHCNNTCDKVLAKTPICQGASVGMLALMTCSQLNLMPADKCSNYFSTMSMQCDLDTKSAKCYDATSCTVSQTCGNGHIEGDETCDDSIYNSDSTSGACTTTCDGYVTASPTCTGIAVKNCSSYATNGFMLSGKACTDYYSTSENAQCTKSGMICGTSTTCTIPEPVCGNGATEGSEICDDGSNNGLVGYCNTGCTAQTPVPCTGLTISQAFAGKTMCYDLGPTDLATPASECSNYYSIMNYQCSYDKKSGNCAEGTMCTVPEKEVVCGDGKVEGKEKCDNGTGNSNTIPGACSIKCDGYVAAAPSGSGLLSTGICTKVTEIGSGECVQLVNLYNSTSGANWTNSSNRGNTKNICRNGGAEDGFEYSGSYYSGNDSGWNGIYCIDNHVIGLAFKNNNLVGDFDVNFYELPNLILLAIPNNTGINKMSDTISGAQSLIMLKMNGGIGEFPAGIAYLQNLEYLWLDDIGTEEMWYIPGLFPKLKGISLADNHLTTVSDALATNWPDLEFVDLDNNCIDVSSLSPGLIQFLNDRAVSSGRASNQTNCEQVQTKCGDNKTEGAEMCDNGESNGQAGMCNKTCDGFVPKKLSCGDNIISQELGEVCDQGMLNGLPGQCNTKCTGRTVYSTYCGDKICQSAGSCALSGTVTCADLNTTAAGKDLCSTVGCSLQYVNNSYCKGTVSCTDITPDKFWGTVYGAQKYCNIAGCSWDDKTALCTLPKGGKAPSCGDLGKTIGIMGNTSEYCPREPGCSLVTNASSTICVGGDVLRTDKVSEAKCATINGTWTVEDKNSCPSDCDTTCGNGTCDAKETVNNCAKDCVTDWPSITYSANAPKNGGLLNGPITATVYLPKDCKVINNNTDKTYSFKYNGSFVFQVMCSWFDKPRNLIANVNRINSTTFLPPNAQDIYSASGSLIYYNNKDNLVDEVSPSQAMADAAKKSLLEQIRATTTSGDTTTEQEIKIKNDVSFANGADVTTKMIFEKTIDKAGSTKQISITIPADTTLKTTEKGKKSDFNGVFLAPTAVTGGAVLVAATNAIDKTIDTIIQAGDTGHNELSAEDVSGNVAFTMTVETTKALGSWMNIYRSQDGTTWEFYTGVLVEPCASGENNSGYNCATFEIPHLTYYALTDNTTVDTGGTDEGTPAGGTQTSGGGGGGTTVNQCTADRDCKNSYLNTLCGPCSEAAKVAEVKAKQTSVVCYSYSPELNGAYAFAFANAITTIDDCEKANLQGTLLRSHMAKMMSNFAINTLGLKPNTGTVCPFIDMSKESDEMKFYANLACQLGLMGLNDQGTANETFNPNETVTRAQFGTVLSRLIRQDENNGGTPYYTKHLTALKDAGIMTKIDMPNAKELRGFVMLMLQRVTSQVSPAENGGKTLRELVKEFFSKK